jgi:hypothetical protein
MSGGPAEASTVQASTVQASTVEASTEEASTVEASTVESFEYAVIKVVPRVQRGESMNAGVILYSQGHGFLGCRVYLDEDRVRALDPAADLTSVTAALAAIDEACRTELPPGQPAGARFRWLTAPRSTVVQPGPVHSGLTANPAGELQHLFETLVR